jgi:hypothetical protein
LLHLFSTFVQLSLLGFIIDLVLGVVFNWPEQLIKMGQSGMMLQKRKDITVELYPILFN